MLILLWGMIRMEAFNKMVETEIKVRLPECDPYEIAHNSNYFTWFEMGRLQYAQESGYELTDIGANDDVVYITLHTKCKFIKACKYNDELIVQTKIRKPPVLYAKFDFEQIIINKKTGELIAKCTTENAAVNKAAQKVLLLHNDSAILKLKDKE